MKTLAGFLVGVAGLVLAFASDMALAATECNTGPPPNAPMSGSVAGSVVVNAGDFCVLGGAIVSGGVRVNDGGILIVCGSVINGGFIANGAANLIFGAEEIDCAGNVINGAVQISNTGPGVLSPAPSIALERSTVNGGVHLSGNRGPIALASNRIAGGLFCANNAFDLDNEGLSNAITGPARCKFGD